MFIFNLKSPEEFANWKSLLDGKVAALIERVLEDMDKKLDYSIDSLDILEQWILGRYDVLKPPPLPQSDIDILDSAGCYVGQCFRNQVGGEWTVELGDTDQAFLGIPGIRDFKNSNSEVVYPHTWVTASINRRTGHFVSSLYMKIVTQ